MNETNTSTTTATVGPLLFTLRHVADVAAARAFYTEQLGFTITDENPAFLQFAQPGGQGAIFAIGQETETTPNDAELWWSVPNADALHDTLVARGVTISQPLTDEPFGRAFSITDPAGQTVSFFQPRQQ